MANEDEKRFEVVFVSSDESAQARAWLLHGCTEAPEAPTDPMAVLVALQAQAGYMEEMHGDWLRVPFDSPLRDALKQQCAVVVVVVVVAAAAAAAAVFAA